MPVENLEPGHRPLLIWRIKTIRKFIANEGFLNAIICSHRLLESDCNNVSIFGMRWAGHFTDNLWKKAETLSKLVVTKREYIMNSHNNDNPMIGNKSWKFTPQSWLPQLCAYTWRSTTDGRSWTTWSWSQYQAKNSTMRNNCLELFSTDWQSNISLCHLSDTWSKTNKCSHTSFHLLPQLYCLNFLLDSRSFVFQNLQQYFHPSSNLS